MKIQVKEYKDQQIVLEWEKVENASSYVLMWKDRARETMCYKALEAVAENSCVLAKAPLIPYYLKVQALSADGKVLEESEVLKTQVTRELHPQLEKMSRGMAVIKTEKGNFISWRMFREEVTGSCETGLTGTNFVVIKNGQYLAYVTDSTNYLDADGTLSDGYRVLAVAEGADPQDTFEKGTWKEEKESFPWTSGSNYLDIPVQAPQGGVTPAGEAYSYHPNDISVGDIDGDGEYEYIVKWDPTNSHDVSHKGYTGNCYIDCYKLSGKLLWRVDMGVNIRSGAHYTQFMVYDFNGDGKAEMAVKSAPGTKVTIYKEDGTTEEHFITLPQKDAEAGVTHEDNYVCSAQDYHDYLVDLFKNWLDHPEVAGGRWPKTLEECFGLEKKYEYPLNQQDAEALVDYFIKVYAPSRSPKNHLENFEGFIFKGPEYLTMLGGDGRELDTIDYPFPRVDDGLMWGDYSWNRIEPCNRVDRFLAGVAYLDGERPYLIMCRGYYTRATLAAYDFFDNHFRETWKVDSGFVPMPNPFDLTPFDAIGTDPVYGILAGQGNHNLSTADVDGDGCMEIIYGAAVIDHDGSVLYSSYGELPDGTVARFGHGDAMHVANIDPDRPGYEIFNVYEGGTSAPYGFALRDAETGKAYFGEPATTDLGRCMIGDIDPEVPGLQVWVNEVYNVKGEKLPHKALSTNQSIRWSADLSTQVTDGAQYLGTTQTGVINDLTHGVMLKPENTMTNNGTKGNPCLVANLFGDYREQIVLRTTDDKALRIYMNTELSHHKLFTLMQDPMYRCSVAWQNNCYNQPGYTSFYYASDMKFDEVIIK